MLQESFTEPLAATASPAPPQKMTYEEFLAWADEDTYAEWVNGEVIMLGPASFFHVPVGDGGIYRSAVLSGLWLKVDWLWQQPLPPLLGVLREWGLV